MPDGTIIFYVLITKAGKPVLIQETLTTEEYTPEISDKDILKLSRNFETEKFKN